ncbi:MAG: hypothetical protein COS99_01720 [Candidatus Omnitrophica bacterium CG07_land_8_20_14_0_80_42_15]|uniref:Prepilin-type N-terminal cleavage/methylation domain-containing protein n=1 Tax=Candidatus Aquitaenariimonas noxiae TaxID=1974741 RepID=A0A2J0KWJ5_9BACT|nr:MAG: hypothetical protein COS99_01720 [Candidatus Omnitrophica bacterium CG07_land_8_20_14_0_80_42_15]
MIFLGKYIKLYTMNTIKIQPSNILNTKSRKKAFILIELLLSAALIGIVLGGTLVIYSMAANAWQYESRRITLQRQARVAMEKMTRGLGGSNGIREANSVWIDPIFGRFYYRSGVDDNIRSLKRGFLGFANDEIIYWELPSWPQSIATNVQNLTFTISGKIVTINLTVQDIYRGSIISVNLVTQVRMRN